MRTPGFSPVEDMVQTGRERVYLYTYTYKHIHMCMHIYIYMYILLYRVCIYCACVDVNCGCICICVRTCMCVCICMYECMNVHMHSKFLPPMYLDRKSSIGMWKIVADTRGGKTNATGVFWAVTWHNEAEFRRTLMETVSQKFPPLLLRILE